MVRLVAGGATDVGMVRSSNQDALLVADPSGLYAVADGMGGHAAGEVASATALAALEEAWRTGASPTPEALRRAGEAANRRVYDTAGTDPALQGMGTTLVAVSLVPGGEGQLLAVINVGDSRLYRLRDGDLDQVTVDHSLVNELVAQGKLAAEEAEFHPQKNVLTRALGVDPEVAVDLFEVDPRPGDRLLLCSDGLVKEVSEVALASILRRHRDPSAAAQELITEARLSGGSDNITAVVVDVVTDDELAAGTSRPVVAAPAVPEAVAAWAASAPVAEASATTSLGRSAPPAPATAPVVAQPPAPATAPADLAGDTRTMPVITSTPAPAPVAAPSPPPRRAQRAVTLGVVAFALALVLVLAAGAAGVELYARGTYFVRSDASGNVLVYRGRPGGVLWIKPTVAATTGKVLGQVTPAFTAQVRDGVSEPSVTAAQQFVERVTAAPGTP